MKKEEIIFKSCLSIKERCKKKSSFYSEKKDLDK
jgi:hypothetical protein